MGERAKNMGQMLNNPKQRNMYFMIIGVAALTLIGGVYFATRGSGIENVAPAGASVSSVPLVNSTPGESSSEEYNKKVREANAEEAEKALKNNGTFVGTLTGNSTSDVSPIDLVDKQKEEAKRLKAEQEAKEYAELQKVQEIERQKLAQAQPQPNLVVNPSNVINTQQMSVNATPLKTAKPKYSNEDYILIATMMGTTKAKVPNSEFNYAGQKPENVQNSGQQVSQATNNSVTGTTQNTQTPVEPLAKAGTILNAILETSVNSDEPGPILAKVVSGPLKGTKLIGSIQNVGEKVILQFSTANMPSLSSSVKISAVAIDPNTTRTALASDVDHHYFQRYGILLASSFLSGWAQAIQQNNQTTTISPITGAVITTPNGNLTSRDINRQALGNVGTELAQDTKQRNQNLQPTVTVNSGIAIGIFLVEDFVTNKQ